MTSAMTLARYGLLAAFVSAGVVDASDANAQTNGVSQTETAEADAETVDRSKVRLKLLLSFVKNELRAASLKKTRLISEQAELTQERAQLSALGDKRRPPDDVRMEQIENRLATVALETTEVDTRLLEIAKEHNELQRRLDEANGIIREDEPDSGESGLSIENGVESSGTSSASIWLDGKRQIQEALVYLGGYNALIDGDFGPRTAQAVRVYQGRQSAEVTGVLTGEQEAALLEQAETQRTLYGVTTFSDDEHGYQLSYPSYLLSEAEEVSGLERRMITPDGEGELRVTVVNGADDIDGLYDEAAALYQVQYRRKRDDWFVVAGLLDEERIIYDTVRKVDAKLVRARLSYPIGQRDLWSPFAVIMFNTFSAQPAS
ncbi:MAG: peptidoglycan-binding domain-containing protein [Geminicoccaceae bacterium]|jgi:hypothetical protein